MAKTYSQFVCQQCGRASPRQMGKCPGCNEWNTMVEEIVQKKKDTPRLTRKYISPSEPKKLGEISSEGAERTPLAIEEFSRVLGGGIVPGSVVLIGGDPGIGKSTLMLQVALLVAQSQKVLYVSGEESEQQIKLRANRVLKDKGGLQGHKNDLFLVTETNLETIFDHIQATTPNLLVIDSIQTTFTSTLDSSAGSVSQVRETASRFRELAKNSGLSVFIIGHVTKDGAIAGPRVLEHIVDTVLYLEGDRHQTYRLLRSVKNRFGATSEVGVFEMHQTGMIEVPNPSEAFLTGRLVNAPGSAVAVTMEGTRPILIEVQGLASPTPFGNPRRTANGVDFNRLLLTTAVLTKRAGVRLSDQDVFVNIIGGLRVTEPSVDLAVAVALASSVKDRPVRADTVLIGEIGLSGELRMVSHLDIRLNEAEKLGFKRAVVPTLLSKSKPSSKRIEIVESRSLREAINNSLFTG